jgi:hypothetical protein
VHFDGLYLDMTYDCGVTKICTRNIYLKERPVVMAGCFIHRRKDTATFAAMARLLEFHAPRIIETKAVFTDCDLAMRGGFKSVLKNTFFGLCRNHARSNLTDFATKNNIPSQWVDYFLGIGDTPGIVDLSTAEYEEKLLNPDIPAKLLSYWLRYKDELVREAILKDVLEANGIVTAKPWEKLTTNPAESLHFSLKKNQVDLRLPLADVVKASLVLCEGQHKKWLKY